MEIIGTEQNGNAIGRFLNLKIRLFIKDHERVQPRDGILRDYDDVNYYVEMAFGAKKGMTIAFLKETVIRIEPIQPSYRGGKNRQT